MRRSVLQERLNQQRVPEDKRRKRMENKYCLLNNYAALEPLPPERVLLVSRPTAKKFTHTAT